MMVTHDPQVASHADRVIYLMDGQLKPVPAPVEVRQ
jgi:ABC-type lipoprotein export system ATPase subunit